MRHIEPHPRFNPLKLIEAVAHSWPDGGFTLRPNGTPYIARGYDEYAVALEDTECRSASPPTSDEVCFYLMMHTPLLGLRGRWWT